MSAEFIEIYDNIMRVKDEIANLGVNPDEIKLLAATKTQSIERINYVIEKCGISLIGENRVSELKEKAPFYALPKENVHFIGHLQTNKIKTVLQNASLIQSVDSLHLAQEIDKEAKKMGIKINILIEINSGREEAKSGVFPENAKQFISQIKSFDSLIPSGIMTMAPKCEKQDDYIPYFETAQEIFELIFKNEFPNCQNPILSMGMSDSYLPAIRCKSNLIRLGTAIFGKRA